MHHAQGEEGLTATTLGDHPLAMVQGAGMVCIDRAMRIIALTGDIFAQHGLTAEATIGRSLDEVLPAAAWWRARCHWQAALDGKTSTVDWEADANGRRIDYWLGFAPLPDGAVMIAQDVTARAAATRKLERRLQQQEAVARLGSIALANASVSDLCSSAAVLIHEVLDAVASAVLEDCPGSGLRLLARRGEALPPPVPPSSEGPPQVFEHARRTRLPLRIADLATEHRYVAPVLADAGMKGLVVAPICAADFDFGVLGACSRDSDAFDDDDLAFLQSIANVIAESVARERSTQLTAAAEDRLASFWDCSDDLLAVLSPDGRFLRVSGAWARDLGWSEAQLVGTPVGDVMHEEDPPVVPVDGSPAPAQPVTRCRTADGSYRSIQWNVRRGPDGTLHAVGRDVSESMQNAEELGRRARLLADTERLAGVGSWEDDFAAGEFRVSANLRSMLELGDVPSTTRSLIDRVHPDDRAGVAAMMVINPSEEHMPHPCDFRVVLADGAERCFSSRIEWMHTADGSISGLRGTAQDVTERLQADDALMASEDRFRRGFENAPLPMAVIDAGSGAFQRVNAAFSDLVRRSDTDLAEFSLADVCDPDSESSVREICGVHHDGVVTRELRFLRADGTDVWGNTHVSRLESDCADDPAGGHSLLVQIVDVTERHIQEDALREQLAEVFWIGEIRRALLEDRFELHAQPIVNIESELIVHHELLLRMRDHDGELVPPGHFLPTAERYGDIRDIDRWVINQGIEISARNGMSVAINLSGVSVGDPSLVEDIELAISAFSADPTKLIFEITETCLVGNEQAALALGTRLRELGCCFALDDFGTGYGGLHYLKALPLDYLKIDREFVADALNSEPDRHLIWAAVNLAERFGLTTIAEGIEDAATLELLKEMGVDEAQGFHIGRPEEVHRS